jgi:polyribonucleotide nucleotidyltransferase
MSHGSLARMANFSAIGRFNDTAVLVTIVNKLKTPPATFLPLTVIINFFLHSISVSISI